LITHLGAPRNLAVPMNVCSIVHLIYLM